MKDESEFRTDFIKALKKHCAIWYMSSMTRAGIPDVHLLSDGNCAWLELKFAPSLPKSPRAETLKHKFTAGQRRFLKRVQDQGHPALGVVGYQLRGRVLVACPSLAAIGPGGGLTKSELLRHRPLDLREPDFGPRFLAAIFPQI